MEQQQALLSRSKSGKKKKGSSRMGLRSLVKACWTSPISDCKCYGDVLEQHQQQNKRTLITDLPDDLLVECLARIPRGALQDSMMVCRKWHGIVRSDDYYHVRQRLGGMERLVIVFGGSGAGLSCFIYSQPSGQWKAGFLCSADATLLDPSSLVHAQPAVLNRRIFVLGSEQCTMTYDWWSCCWSRAAPMLHARKKFACAAVSDRIYVAGGASRMKGTRDAVISEAEVYIPELDKWKRIPNMPRRRYGCIGAAVGGLFYVIGGIKRAYAYVGSMDVFDPSSNTWLKSKPLPMGSCVISCTVVDCCIYMLASHAVELSFWVYDTRSHVWNRINLPPIPSPLRIDNVLKFSCVTVGNAVHIVQLGGSIDDLFRRGGHSLKGTREGLVLVYDTSLREWSKGPCLPDVRSGAICTVIEC